MTIDQLAKYSARRLRIEMWQYEELISMMTAYGHSVPKLFSKLNNIY